MTCRTPCRTRCRGLSYSLCCGTPYTPVQLHRVQQSARGYGRYLWWCRVDLNGWHHAIHQITGDIALRFNGATAADLERWAKLLREVAEEMEAVAKL
jgi:hypothetical protein